ncbi:MAG TPA: COX15/CtaA family protein [Verrucomicrobiae bacterium]|nr:COX15/CtaA family protein [Verrucomicrobiae bacterium]
MDNQIQPPSPVTPTLLRPFLLFTACLTFVLLGAGGLVTSHGVGMAVPDWPNTFGYNMFFFPFSQWVGGIFYEHSHRLIASATGLATTILALWLHGTKARRLLRWGGVVVLAGSIAGLAASSHKSDSLVGGITGLCALAGSFFWPNCAPAAPWLRRVGFAAFLAVVLQGVLGGLRVVLFKDQIGIFHAALAQIFFTLICAVALFSSRWWEQRFGSPWAPAGDAGRTPQTSHSHSTRFVCISLVATSLILIQLVLGATMRHQHAGLSIPDFPTAYGKLWPALDSQSIARYNAQRIEVVDLNPITSLQIVLQMAHRLLAGLILIAVSFGAWSAWTERNGTLYARRLSALWLGLILIQVLLGAATIWSNKAADIATAHVLVGALSLALGCNLSLVLLAERRRFFQSLFARDAAPDLVTGLPASAMGLKS